MSGLLRCGKSCRLRWTNYLRPDLKRGILTEAEENLILELHATLGNRWSRIAVQLPGRTDNEIKNFWNTRLKKRLRSMGLDPDTHKPIETSDGTDMDQTVDSNLEEHSSAATPGSQHSEHGSSSPDHPPLAPGSHFSGEIAAPVKTLEGDPACGNALINMDRSKPEPMIMNPKQDLQASNSEPINMLFKQGLQSYPDLQLSHTKDEEPSSLSHMENFHIVSSLCHDGPKVEDTFMSDLHPHARHLRMQDENNIVWLNGSHEMAGENPSSGIFQDLDVRSNLLRQSSGFGFSDMGVGIWSCLGEVIHGQAPSCSATLSSWSDLRGAGRPLQEPELQKLAAILDQM